MAGEHHLDVRALVEGLRRNARVIAGLVDGVPEEQARWKPARDQWSILEVVAHLADEEVEDFRTRLDSTLHRPEDAWKPIDPEGWAVQRRYNEGALSDSVDRFVSARARSVEWLNGLVSPDWGAAHRHQRLGDIRAGDLLTSWVAHDHIHIRQLNRLHREFLLATSSSFSARYAGRW